jgi:hypothetical protein
MLHPAQELTVCCSLLRIRWRAIHVPLRARATGLGRSQPGLNRPSSSSEIYCSASRYRVCSLCKAGVTGSSPVVSTPHSRRSKRRVATPVRHDLPTHSRAICVPLAGRNAALVLASAVVLSPLRAPGRAGRPIFTSSQACTNPRHLTVTRTRRSWVIVGDGGVRGGRCRAGLRCYGALPAAGSRAHPLRDCSRGAGRRRGRVVGCDGQGACFTELGPGHQSSCLPVPRCLQRGSPVASSRCATSVA